LVVLHVMILKPAPLTFPPRVSWLLERGGASGVPPTNDESRSPSGAGFCDHLFDEEIHASGAVPHSKSHSSPETVDELNGVLDSAWAKLTPRSGEEPETLRLVLAEAIVDLALVGEVDRAKIEELALLRLSQYR
jgi:hypothetical protein